MTREIFFIMQEISLCDISGITTKAPCEVALIGERHVRIEISDFVMRTFVLSTGFLSADFWMHFKMLKFGILQLLHLHNVRRSVKLLTA